MDQEHGERKQTVRYQAFWFKLYPYPGKQYYGKRRVKKNLKKRISFVCVVRDSVDKGKQSTPKSKLYDKESFLKVVSAE